MANESDVRVYMHMCKFIRKRATKKEIYNSTSIILKISSGSYSEKANILIGSEIYPALRNIAWECLDELAGCRMKHDDESNSGLCDT
uniref:AlNc14C80G5258 protein n=1 Tax=Albugo laibachii Nc14 TaxID=890382 RepID=F0WF64_9STRA|nr:AlNc14C80G5258 [Albugo laibachii Nc14]|eukprot:CCA19846.1 AlNc14C80G5258 [Albugo laibachii Nc14]